MAVRFWRRNEETAGPAPRSVDEEAGASAPRTARWRRGLSRLRAAFRRPFEHAAGARQASEDLYTELEEALIQADVGVETALDIIARVRTRMKTAPRDDRPAADVVRDQLKQELHDALGQEAAPADDSDGTQPRVVLVVGVNGVGKTTSIAKLAARYQRRGRTVLLVAGDTFRAAAIEQLAVWAGRLGLDIVKREHGASPTAVVFDGLRAALARGTQVVLIDTAGRLHTKTPLMEELKKMHRVIGREVPGAPHEVLLVLDAGTGQNALSQARTFQEAFPLTGVLLSKMDGSAKGGVAVAVARRLGVPIRYVGLGEGLDDLEAFSADAFIDALFGDADPSLDAPTDRP